MLIVLGTLWPLIGMPLAIVSSLIIPRLLWRWIALLVAPGVVFALHAYWVLPWYLNGGNLLAAVIYGLMIMFLMIYYPLVMVLAGLWAFRQLSAAK
jgi:hypothetical protein